MRSGAELVQLLAGEGAEAWGRHAAKGGGGSAAIINKRNKDRSSGPNRVAIVPPQPHWRAPLSEETPDEGFRLKSTSMRFSEPSKPKVGATTVSVTMGAITGVYKRPRGGERGRFGGR